MIKSEKWPVIGAGSGTPCSSHVWAVSLNCPAEANAFSGPMMEQLTEQFQKIHDDANCCLMLLMGRGRHFSAGANLEWMRQSRHLDEEGNRQEASKLLAMYESLQRLPMPTLAVAHGSTFGGGNGLLACCDVVIAEEASRFCLSEVKLGLIPAVILPYLARKMDHGFLLGAALSATPFGVDEALRHGLVGHKISRADAASSLRQHINRFLGVSPSAQRAFKALWQELRSRGFAQDELTVSAIARARASEQAALGLDAFLNKEASPFDWKLADEVDLAEAVESWAWR
jgi:methylglutaconyl-CoA hydratase